MTKNRMFPLIMRNELTNSLNAYKTKSLDQSWLWPFTFWWFRIATEKGDGKKNAEH